MNFEWKQTKSPAGAIQWIPKNEALHTSVADAHVKGKFNSIVMLTTDLALKADPEYRKIVESFLADPEKYKIAFGKAWSTQELIRTSWSSAASFRGTDLRGGANGARIALAPQKDWAINNPKELQKVIQKLEAIRAKFNKAAGETQVSLADIIIIGGAAAVEKSAKDAGVEINVPFIPGRGDTTQELTDVTSFSLLEPTADAFRNYYSKDSYLSPTAALVDTADKLNLTVPEMTVLLGGMRTLGANAYGTQHGILTDKPGSLTNDFFVNLLDMSTKWQQSEQDGLYEGIDRKSGKVKYTATPVDLIFGSSSELRAVAEVYAFDNAQERFVKDFVKAWTKVMRSDRLYNN